MINLSIYAFVLALFAAFLVGFGIASVLASSHSDKKMQVPK